MGYCFLSSWMLPFGLALALRVIPFQWRGLRRATGGREKTYWRLNLAGYLLAAAGMLGTTAAMVLDLAHRPAQAGRCWACLTGMPAEAESGLLLVLLAVLVPALVLVCVARYFGYVDEDERWCRPDWLVNDTDPSAADDASDR